MNNNIKDIQIGDVFSETMYAIVTKINKDTVDFKHQGTGETISLSFPYVEKLLSSSDQYSNQVRCGWEDKFWTQAQITKDKATGVQVGDLRQKGIKRIWEEIGQEVFSVKFTKKDQPLSKKAYDLAVQGKIDEIGELIEKAQRNKKGIVNVAKEQILNLINNPILDYIPGEERLMRGYKLQFSSPDGFYKVFDMDKGEERLVNLNTVSEITVNGTQYVKV